MKGFIKSKRVFLVAHFFAAIALSYTPESGSDAEKKVDAGKWITRPVAGLPNVLILGDSISIGYTLSVQKLLEGQANVFRPHSPDGSRPVNCQGTVFAVAKINEWLAGRKWDVIHFNFGLHDLKHVNAETGRNSEDSGDPRQADLETYSDNLNAIVKKLKATGTQLIFATTTPVQPGINNPLREPEAPIRYNVAARKIMKRHGVRLNDLFGFCEGREEELQLPVNVHFNSRGSQALAEQVANAILEALQ